MQQTRLFAETDAQTAKSLLSIYEVAFEDDGFPVSAFDQLQDDLQWNLSVYTPTENVENTLERMKTLAHENNIQVEFEQELLPEIDWVAETLRDLHPVRAGNFVIHGSHEPNAPQPHEYGIMIDAGLAFGTGHHGTTAGCLDILTKVSKRRKFFNALDLGTGSGVLAIAIAKSHPAKVLASDIDPVATITAKENSRINGTAKDIECITAAGLGNRRFREQGPFDLIIANILARPLQSMATDIADHMSQNSALILSGLLPHQKAPIVARFRQQGLMLQRAYIRDGWLTIWMEKY
jgi:ribosomal protein L11 methyltransferase